MVLPNLFWSDYRSYISSTVVWGSEARKIQHDKPLVFTIKSRNGETKKVEVTPVKVNEKWYEF